MTESSVVEQWLTQMGRELLTRLGDTPLARVGMIGIHSGGVRIAEQLHQRLGLSLPLGTLDISFYRDDFTRIGLNPQVKTSSIGFDVEDRTLILVDDVLYSGRTVRAAMNEIFDYGRPGRILLAVLVERDGHELPIRADVRGARMALGPDQQVKLNENGLGLSIISDARPREAVDD